MVMILYLEDKSHVIVHQVLQFQMSLLIKQKKREGIFWHNNKPQLSKRIQIKETLLHKHRQKKMLMIRLQQLQLTQLKKNKKEKQHKLKQMQIKLLQKQKLKKILLMLKLLAKLKWLKQPQSQPQLRLNKQLLMH